MTMREWHEMQERLGMIGDAADGADLRAELLSRLGDADARDAEVAWRREAARLIEEARWREAAQTGAR